MCAGELGLIECFPEPVRAVSAKWLRSSESAVVVIDAKKETRALQPLIGTKRTCVDPFENQREMPARQTARSGRRTEQESRSPRKSTGRAATSCSGGVGYAQPVSGVSGPSDRRSARTI